GPWSVTENSFTTTVDLSLIEPWLGTEQKRFFKLDGDRLEITTIPSRRPEGRGALMHGPPLWQPMKTQASDDNWRPLLGAWRIVSMAFVDDETGERVPGFGDEPKGYLVFHPGRTFAFIVTAGTRSELARVPVMAYSGPSEVTAETFATKL